VVLNAEAEYSEINWINVQAKGSGPYIIDTRGGLNYESMRENGIEFDVLGVKN
jgi:predicted nucleic acid-binding Zn ribbon protein